MGGEVQEEAAVERQKGVGGGVWSHVCVSHALKGFIRACARLWSCEVWLGGWMVKECVSGWEEASERAIEGGLEGGTPPQDSCQRFGLTPSKRCPLASRVAALCPPSEAPSPQGGGEQRRRRGRP